VPIEAVGQAQAAAIAAMRRYALALIPLLLLAGDAGSGDATNEADVAINGDFTGRLGEPGDTNNGGGTLTFAAGRTCNGWVIRDGVYIRVTGQVPVFSGAFSAILVS
jgi:hypothetical protein